MKLLWTKVLPGRRLRPDIVSQGVYASLVSALLILSSAISCGEDDKNLATRNENSDLKDRFLREAPRAWTEFFQRSQAMRGKFTETFSQGRGKPQRSFDFEFAMNGVFIKEVKHESDGDLFITARNPEYAFALMGRDDSKTYSINWLEQCGASSESDELIENGVQEVSFAAKLPVWLLAKSMADWLKDPEYMITKVTSIQLQGEDLVRVDYEHNALSDNSVSEHPPIVEQYVVLAVR